VDTRALLIAALPVGPGRSIAAVPDAVDRVIGEWGAPSDRGSGVAAAPPAGGQARAAR
jgi:hypothetical protein